MKCACCGKENLYNLCMDCNLLDIKQQMENSMDASFILDDTESTLKPLPYTLGKRTKVKSESVKLPDTYPKFEVEFYDVIKSCAEYIDKIHCVETRIKLNKDLNKIFILRHKPSAMRMFRELVSLVMLQKKEVSL